MHTRFTHPCGICVAITNSVNCACVVASVLLLVPSSATGEQARGQIGYTEFQAGLKGGMFPFQTSMRACVIDADATNRREIAPDLSARENSWTQFSGWSPDGRLAVVGSGWESPENAAWEKANGGFRMTEGWLYDMWLFDLEKRRRSNLTAVDRVSIYNTGLFFWPGDANRLGFQALIGPTSHPFSMDRDGRNKKDLTDGASAFTYGFTASPDGTKISYHKDYQVYIANADGSQATLVDAKQPFNFAPTWSPDGAWLLFVAGQHYDCHPHVVRRDGSGLRKIADRQGYRGVVECLDFPAFHSASSDLPVWSTDGKWIIYTAKFGDRVELMRATIDGQPERLTHSESNVLHFHPQPSPDGNWIVFGSTSNGARRQYVARSDGSGAYPLTAVEPGWGAMWAHWRPERD